MIRDWEEHNLCMDFSKININGTHPSDVDMFYVGKKIAIFGEIKNRRGTFTDSQRMLYQRLVNGYRGKAIALYIKHNVDVHDGGTLVDIAHCNVHQYYLKGFDRWITPSCPLQVIDVFEYYEKDL